MPNFQGVEYADNEEGWGQYNAALQGHRAHMERTTGQELREVRNPDGTINLEQTAAANQQAAQSGPAHSPSAPPQFQALIPGRIYTNPAHGHPMIWNGAKFVSVANTPDAVQAA